MEDDEQVNSRIYLIKSDSSVERFIRFIIVPSFIFLTFQSKLITKYEGGDQMGRGKNFKHKEKGHPGNFPKNSISERKEHSRQTEQIEDIVTHEAFKNRVKEDEMT